MGKKVVLCPYLNIPLNKHRTLFKIESYIPVLIVYILSHKMFRHSCYYIKHVIVLGGLNFPKMLYIAIYFKLKLNISCDLRRHLPSDWFHIFCATLIWGIEKAASAVLIDVLAERGKVRLCICCSNTTGTD